MRSGATWSNEVDSTVGLVIPTGYSFNLDAFSIYITLAAVFIAQATNTPISMTDLLTILAISLVTIGNLVGNCVATVAVAALEGDIDRARAHAVLDGQAVADDELDDDEGVVVTLPASAR